MENRTYVIPQENPVIIWSMYFIVDSVGNSYKDYEVKFK